MKKILITGSLGQIGTDLTRELRKIYGKNNVIISDIKEMEAENYEVLDVMDKNRLLEIVKKHNIDTIYHLAAILSAKGEENPQLALDININGMLNVLNVAKDLKLTRIFIPSSIAVFGPSTPINNTPQDTIIKPATMYGITKVAGELLCDYYVQKYGVDVRGLRYPGIISYDTLPGGGTTDYAVAIFYDAIKYGKYTSFLNETTMLPMMYMPDCLKATIDLMHTDFEKLKHHSDFNVAAMSFTPKELANEIKKHIPNFEIDYKPDFRQQIADSWPNSIDDTAARQEWNWKPEYDLEKMTADMIRKLRAKLNL